MTYWFLTILFIFGLAVGSFTNVLEMILHKGIYFVKKRSYCDICKHTLTVADLIPLVSFLWLRGKCRYCGTKVSWQHPTIEFLSGLLFLTSGCYVLKRMHIYSFSDLFTMIFFAIAIGFIFEIFLFFALYDVKHRIVPDKVIYPVIIISIIVNIFFALAMHFYPKMIFFNVVNDFSFLWNILAAILGGLFIGIIMFLTRGRGMGGGDLKLIIFMGLILGIKKLITAFYIAIIAGSLIGIIWGIRKGKIFGLKIPFALFLSFGSILSIIYGDYFWNLLFDVK